MKTIRRVLAILLLVFLVALVGYLCYTGSRLPTPDETGGLNAVSTSI